MVNFTQLGPVTIFMRPSLSQASSDVFEILMDDFLVGYATGYEDLLQKLQPLEVFEDQVEMALIDMKTYNKDVAQFGISGYFLYSEDSLDAFEARGAA